MEHRPRQRDALWVALLGELGQCRSAGITQAEQLCCFIKRFTGRVIKRFAEQGVSTDVIDPHELCMSAGHEQRNKRKVRARLGHPRRKQMPLKVMDGNRGQIERPGNRLRDARPDEQGPSQSWPRCVGDGLHIRQFKARLRQHGSGQRHDAAHMVPRGEFRHDATIRSMHGHLCMQRMRQQTALGAYDRYASFIT